MVQYCMSLLAILSLSLQLQKYTILGHIHRHCSASSTIFAGEIQQSVLLTECNTDGCITPANMVDNAEQRLHI